jgi:sarcosine oxidase subunit alpha
MEALHRRHLKMGAKMIEIEGWTVPGAYTTPEEEVRSVIDSVGICDISHYSKVDVKGSQMDQFLDSNFPSESIAKNPGQVQFLAEQGAKEFRPSYCCRLTKDHALLIARPLQHASVVNFEMDSLKPIEKVYLTYVSSTLGGFNIAGPSSHKVLRKLVEVDLTRKNSDAQFCVEAGLADVHSIIVRRRIQSGSKMESFDLYYGRDYSEYLWDVLMEAGREFGLVPFGIEAHGRLSGGMSR